MMYSYYYCLGFVTIKHNGEGKDNHKEELNNIPRSIKILFTSMFFMMFLNVQRQNDNSQLRVHFSNH